MSATQPTFGEVRFQCQKRWPGIDPDILDSWINERYRRVLRRFPWQRTKVQSVIQTVAPYETGTLDATNGSTSVSGTGTTWTTAMSGRAIRITGRNEYYQFTRTADTTGTLDRAYEGDTDTELSYKIWQNVHLLPSDLRYLHSMRVFDSPRDMDQRTQEEMDEEAPAREVYGKPDRYALHMDDTSTPPRQQVELYPVPDDVYGIPFWYSQDPTLFSASDTASFIAPWLNPDLIYSGIESDALRKEKDYTGAGIAESMFNTHMSELFHQEARRMGSRPIKVAAHIARHNVARWSQDRWPREVDDT